MRRTPSPPHRPWFEELHPRAYGWALVCCRRDPERAGEVLQTSYTRILGGSREFVSMDELRAFLFGVIRRVALEHARSARRELDLRAQLQAHLGASRSETEAAAPSPEDLAESHELHGALQRAVDALPQRQREVLHLVFYQGLSLTETAAVLNIKVGSVRQHYARGKEAVRDQCAPSVGQNL